MDSDQKKSDDGVNDIRVAELTSLLSFVLFFLIRFFECIVIFDYLVMITTLPAGRSPILG